MTKDDAKEQLTKCIEQAKQVMTDEEIVYLAKQLCPRTLPRSIQVNVPLPQNDTLKK